jgi:hypothetical protein
MKYLCLCYYDRKMFDALSKKELEALQRECKPHDEALHATGKLFLVASLGFPEQGKALRTGNGRPATLSDGPYAETPEPIGAVFIVEANDIDEAVDLAKKHPGTHIGKYLAGGIEVRPMDHFETF